MKRNKKKGRPIVAGGPGKPDKALEKSTQVSVPIVPKRDPFVKWLESLRPGRLFSTGKKICTVTAVESVNLGRMITLAVAHGLAPNPPVGARGGVRHG